MSTITNTLLTVYELLLDPVTALTSYTHLRWFRSPSGADGPWEPITAAAAAGASIVGDNTEPHALNGKTLSLLVNGAQLDIVFVGADPFTIADVIAEIAGATALLVPTDDGDTRLRLTTVLTGSGASIEVVASDGALALGLQAGVNSIGVDADDTLVSTQHDYQHVDQNGSRDFWYRTQLVNNTTLAVAPTSPAFPGTIVPVIPYALTIAAYVQLIDLRGRPIEGRRIVVANVFLPNTVGSYNVFRHSDSFLTDVDGYGELRLVRGATIDVHVEGTTYTRRITLPGAADPADIVNLLDPALTVEDEFGIQEPYIDFAIRTS